ncbi:MAG TPA: hypothetical protein VE669_08210, partial [Actinomycetota bacterium]|nr:hypothetical protein [Actinomycetota bacterium]
RRAEAKIAALQLELDSAITELRELADRAGGSAPPAPDPLLAVVDRSVPEAAPTPVQPPYEDDRPVVSEPPPDPVIPAVLTEPPAAMQRLADPDRPRLSIPPSDEVARLLREHLT